MFLSVKICDTSAITVLLKVNPTEHSTCSNLFIFQTCSGEKKPFNKLRDQFRNVTDMQNAHSLHSPIYYLAIKPLKHSSSLDSRYIISVVVAS